MQQDNKNYEGLYLQATYVKDVLEDDLDRDGLFNII